MSSIKAGSQLPLSSPFVRNNEPGGAELGSVRNEALQKKFEEAEKVAQDFETMFMDMMVKSMRQTAQREDVSNAEDIYQGMLDSEYSKSMTASQSFGIRAQILDWLKQTDPNLQSFSSANMSSEVASGASQDKKIDSKSLLNDSLALKAATQAYKMSSGPR